MKTPAILRKMIFSGLLILVFYSSFAQCSYTLLPGYIQITSTQTITAANAPYWICENVVLTIDSSHAGAFFMEQNSTIRFVKASYSCDAVYAKNGCTVINNSGGCVAITANPNNVTVLNTGSGSASIGFTCQTMVYNYSNVGGSACQAITGIPENNSGRLEDLLFPNPVSKTNGLSLKHVKEIESIRLTDMNGKTILEQTNSFIELNNVLPGFYFLHIRSENNYYVKKLLVLD